MVSEEHFAILENLYFSYICVHVVIVVRYLKFNADALLCLLSGYQTPKIDVLAFYFFHDLRSYLIFYGLDRNC